MRFDPFLSILVCTTVIGAANYYMIPFITKQENLWIVIPLAFLVFLTQCALGSIYSVCLPATFGYETKVHPSDKAAKFEIAGLTISLVTFILTVIALAAIALHLAPVLSLIIALGVIGFVGGSLSTGLILAGATDYPYE